MWRQIRGMGLSYNYRMYCSPESGQMYFQLFKSSQLVQAYQVAREIMVHLSLSLSLSFLFLSLSLSLSLCMIFFIRFYFILPQTGYLSGSTPFDDVQLESAISGVIYEIIEREKTVSDAASDALMCYLKQVDNSHNR